MNTEHGMLFDTEATLFIKFRLLFCTPKLPLAKVQLIESPTLTAALLPLRLFVKMVASPRSTASKLKVTKIL